MRGIGFLGELESFQILVITGFGGGVKYFVLLNFGEAQGEFVSGIVLRKDRCYVW